MIKASDRISRLKEIATRKETVSAALIVVFVVATLFSMFISPQLYRGSVHEGDIALKNVYAPYDFTYTWGVNEEKTQAAKDRAVMDFPVVLRRDIAGDKKTTAAIKQFFDALEANKTLNMSIGDITAMLNKKFGTKISAKNLKTLIEYPDPSELMEKTLMVFGQTQASGYIDEGSLNYLREKTIHRVVIIDDGNKSEVEEDVRNIVKQDGLRQIIDKLAAGQFDGDRKTRQAVAALVSEYAVHGLTPDEKMTADRKESVLSHVQEIPITWEVEKNELVVEKGKRVDQRHIAQLAQLRRVFRPGMTPRFFLGVVLLFVLLVLIAVIYTLFILPKDFLKKTKDITVILLNLFFMVLVADFIVHSPQPGYFIPMAGMGMIITLLVGFNAAFVGVVLMSILISMLLGGGIELTLVLITGSMVGMFAVRDARRRVRILVAGLLAGLAKFAAIACIGLINGMGLDFYLTDGMWGIASGLLSGFMVMGLLPAFEHLFKVPTNISLLELSDLNHPLLKKLAMEAPGTYHHSIMVGNLAESACDAIGANSLLARVGAYYHDIGKMPKAEYFAENEMGSKSRHSKLAPSMSSLIIAKHVKEGIEIAKKYKMNTSIVDFITQHHGDSLIQYFYQKALEKVEDGTSIEEENFRYPGPRPQTKESAIVLLADSVEAASRALNEPTPASVKNLVKKMVNNKFIDGQLDECELTLKDMHNIADSFVRVLMGIFHTRLDYPDGIKKISNGDITLSNDNKSQQRKQKQKKKN